MNQAACPYCQRTAAQVERLRDDGAWECSHVSCPHRRQVTAAPPQRGAEPCGGGGCWRVKPALAED